MIYIFTYIHNMYKWIVKKKVGALSTRPICTKNCGLCLHCTRSNASVFVCWGYFFFFFRRSRGLRTFKRSIFWSVSCVVTDPGLVGIKVLLQAVADSRGGWLHLKRMWVGPQAVALSVVLTDFCFGHGAGRLTLPAPQRDRRNKPQQFYAFHFILYQTHGMKC